MNQDVRLYFFTDHELIYYTYQKEGKNLNKVFYFSPNPKATNQLSKKLNALLLFI